MKNHLSILLLLALLLTFAAPLAAQDDGSAPRIPEGPGFAVGTFDNGRAYSLAQTFSLRYSGTFDGAIVAFGEPSGAPVGEMQWELRRWWPGCGIMGRLIADGSFEPAPLHYNSIVVHADLAAGSYALVLRAAEEQKRGAYWTIIASSGERDVYAGGELLQMEQGGPWAAWDGQDVIGELALVGPDTLFVELH